MHEVTALALATVPLQALKERNNLKEDVVDDVVLGCGRSGRRGTAPTSRALQRWWPGYGESGAGRAAEPVLRLGPRGGEHRRRADHDAASTSW
ncbi:MAG: hypothetical protein MZV49_16580 [Rhodopseudomonas palustris]|nr:hypothetical protein [Rhodopseudomonas palustris]